MVASKLPSIRRQHRQFPEEEEEEAALQFTTTVSTPPRSRLQARGGGGGGRHFLCAVTAFTRIRCKQASKRTRGKLWRQALSVCSHRIYPNPRQTNKQEEEEEEASTGRPCRHDPDVSLQSEPTGSIKQQQQQDQILFPRHTPWRACGRPCRRAAYCCSSPATPLNPCTAAVNQQHLNLSSNTKKRRGAAQSHLSPSPTAPCSSA